MTIVLSDANIFIDLYKIGWLEFLTELKFDVATTDLVFEELYEEQKEVLEMLGVRIIGFDDVQSLYEGYRNLNSHALSIQDYSLVFVARKNGYTLLTKDRKLRSFAKKEGLDVK